MKREPRCCFSGGNLRCPLPATWYPENGTHGYCALHDDAQKRKMAEHEAYAQLQRMHEDAKAYARDLLDGSWKQEREQLIQDTIDGHPEWQRREGEGRTRYAERMIDEVAKRSPGLAALLREKRA